MGLHVITKRLPEGRGRFWGEYTDEQFADLPYVKEYGYLPPGFAAVHFHDAAEINGPKGDALRAMPEIESVGYPYRLTGELVLRWERNERRGREARAANAGRPDPLTGEIVTAPERIV